MQVIRYNETLHDVWNAFIELSRNGTFLLKREYMDYHADRFADCSFLFMEGTTCVAVLPGNLNGTTYHSHQGLTYGGLILADHTGGVLVMNCFTLLLDTLKTTYGVTNLIYHTIPSIYHRYPCEEDLYALFRNNATLVERKMSSVIPAGKALPFKTLRKRGVALAKRESLSVAETDAYAPFWTILTENLIARHQTTPVHSLEEMLLLHNRFPKEIRLVGVFKESILIGGCVVYLCKEVAHIQYIATNETGRNSGALDLLFDTLIHSLYANYPFIDFGVSVEDGGTVLNEGLLFQKEGFGGRAINYDTYEIKL